MVITQPKSFIAGGGALHLVDPHRLRVDYSISEEQESVNRQKQNVFLSNQHTCWSRKQMARDA